MAADAFCKAAAGSLAAHPGLDHREARRGTKGRLRWGPDEWRTLGSSWKTEPHNRYLKNNK